ncbi:DUF1992 domain-containing protein [Brevibacterium renqingii]|uniref:DnaJ family domain-containing protein n=1 Tax=Brevibacterium renqingii TaxID=2776916 RepID=UPI001ADFA283|nr:DUF1992 domain-containing protein [Brevibacterium renqingii]
MNQDPHDSDDEPPRRLNSLEERNAVVESALDRAIKRGDFDDLPGLGKPLTGLHRADDPDWWIKQKLDAEGISGVAPAAFQLRKENAEMEATLDAFVREDDVRDYLAGFNGRVRAAVMDLREGPPIFTPPRNVEHEVAAWRERRARSVPSSGERSEDGQTSPAEPARTEGAGRTAAEDTAPPRRWWQRRRR